MTAVNDLPDYQALFGELDFKTGDPARSVYSPAAYLADLLQLIDDVFTAPELDERRPDIAHIELDDDRTFSLVPYLDIVNEQLERLVAEGGDDDAYDVLRRARYPLGLPFDLDDARVRLLLGFLAVEPDEIRRLFAQHRDPARSARDALGLSEARARILVDETTVDRAFIEANFPGVPTGTGTVAQKIPVDDMLTSTGLSGRELRELLGSFLSDTALDDRGRAETDRASELFVNHGLDGFVLLDDDEEHLVWSDGRYSIDERWFDRAHRLIRLSRWTGRSLTELDRFLRCCCRRGTEGPTLDATALATLAVATRLADAADLDLTAVGVLFGDLDDLGIGDGDRPEDPFDVMFNGRHAETSRELIVADPNHPGATHRPAAYADMDVLSMRGDVLAIENKGFRRRISRGLGVSETALVGIVDGLRAHWADLPDAGPLDIGETIGRRELSLLARIVALCELFDLAHTDLFALLDVLERDPSIRRFNNLALLIDPHPGEMDCFRILEADDASASIWLVQVLSALTAWIADHDLTAEDLAHTTGATTASVAADGRDERIAFYDSLVADFAAHALTPDVLGATDQRTSRVLHRAAAAPEAGLVCPDEGRIVRFDAVAAVDAAHQGLADLDVIHDDDFVGIGLGDRVVDSLVDQLIVLGVIDPDGVIDVHAVPASPDDFSITSDFTALRRPVFEIIHALHRDEASSTEPGDPVDLSVYETDLAGLDATDAELLELYRSLMHQGYLGASGEVIEPDLFAELSDLEAFTLDNPLAPFATTVHTILSERLARFHRESLVIDIDHFATVDLPSDPEHLIENLRFNGYLDEHDVVVDKELLEGLDVRDLNLALEFYPHRHEILAALAGAVRALRVSVATVGPEDLRVLGEQIASGSVAEIVRRTHCADGRLTPAAHALFLDRANLAEFQLNRSIDRAGHEAVFDALARFVTSTQGVRLTGSEIDAIGLDPDARAALVTELIDLAVVEELGRIPRHRLDEFANANNALAFRLTAFPDDSMDVFFVLHAIAVETLARIEAVVRPLETLALRQSEWLLAALQDRLEIGADVVEVVGRHVFGTPRLVEAWMVPLLGSVDADGRVRDDPSDRRFRDAARRTGQFAVLAVRLGLDATATEVVFRDQGLEEKFPEPLHLPADADGFDALLELDVDAAFVGGHSDDPPVGVICVFRDDRLWAYSSDTRELVVSDVALSSLSPVFASLTRVDAAFTDAAGTSWIIGGTEYWMRTSDDTEWTTTERSFGDVVSNFTDADAIDAAFVDHEGRTYLFVGDQYVRYSGDLDLVDEGYPRRIAGNWARELEIELPTEFLGRIDAAVQAGDTTYMFHDDRFVSSDAPDDIRATVDRWGVVRNNLAATGRVDAALSDGTRLHLYSGDQVLSYSSSIENEGVLADEGSVRGLTDLPAPFRDGLDAAFHGPDGSTHLFSGEQFAIGDGDTFGEPADIVSRWGHIRNVIQESGTVDAALTGLDGRTYLFSGDQYVRYSGTRYTSVDEGYPRSIGPDWGGLQRVDAAVVLDGKTYLFGAIHAEAGSENEGEGEDPYWTTYARPSSSEADFDDDAPLVHGYVRYSTHEYSAVDEGYPKPTDDNWWNLPDALVRDGFANPDAVFTGDGGEITLFSDGRIVQFDALHRWWSEPSSLAESWDSIPFDRVDAAFTGKDGRAYLFSGQSFIRYSDPGYTQIDDRYPKSIAAEWGVVDSAIDRSGSVDAAVVTECDDDRTYTYLFCDRQFYRYTTEGSDGALGRWVDEGYPRTIATALVEEPRFAELTADLASGVTAAAADRRTVYLIGRDQTVVHAVSDRLYREYPLVFGTTIGCAVIEHGVVYVESDGWHRAAGLEGTLQLSPSPAPPGMRSFPEDIDRPDAVLIGTDGGVYAFDDGRCHDSLLDRTYPTGEDWGRERNRIEHDGRVDASLVGRDGMLYLFRGDEFVTYSITTGLPVPDTVDGLPRPIADTWGGLTDVHLAFVRGGSTYLLEHPDDQGRFRYVRYSGDDYAEPDDGFPSTADHSWWQIPEMYVEEGFDRVDAVLVEQDDLFLIKGEEFVHFDVAEQAWTYPRPVDRVWRGIWTGREHADVTAAFDGPDLTTTFFLDDGSYVTTEGIGVRTSGPIADRWGVVDNLVRTGRVDAACAHPDGTTYVFAGGQYVRYSGSDYRFVDQGYPKSIVENLRGEAPFANLPPDLMPRLDALFTAGGGLDAVVANERTVYLVEQGNLHVCSQTATADVAVSALGAIKNNLAATGRVDAALRTDDGLTYLFSGDQYVRYSDDFDVVDDGYPRSLLDAEPGWPAQLKVDAAFAGPGATIHLCSGPLCAEIGAGGLTWSPIVERWGRSHNVFTSTEGNVTIDAALVAADGSLYVFKDDQYVRHTNSVDDVVAEGYPRAIVDDFGRLPVAYEAGVHGGFTLDGRTYFTRRDADGREYVRFSDPALGTIDSIYPQPFGHRWGDWTDFLLTDLHTISRFAALDARHTGADSTLAELLGGHVEPYGAIAELCGWDVDEVIWLKRMNAFLVPENPFETAFDLELVLKMSDVFGVAERMESAPRELYELVWRPLFEFDDLSGVGQTLETLLGASVSEADWQVLARQIHDELNTIRRDALLPYVVSITDAETSRDVYAHLLLDPDVESCSQTSRVKEAITAVQLYLHRYFVNLEALDAAGDDDEMTRRRLKQWWQWMRNYRVWEANRKVFLYPENYLRPELRDTKTPAFGTLEEDLLQGELDDTAVQHAYRKYLDHYTEVSRLQIAGGYIYDVDDRPNDRQLVLFGRTKTDPRQYHYRTAVFPNGSSSKAQWSPWIDTKLQIDASKVYPVHAFGRLFVFWATVEQEMQDTDASSGTMEVSETADGNQELKNSKPVEYVLRIWYSFQNLNHDWVPPQALDTKIDPRVGDTDEDGELDEAAIRSMQMREPLPISSIRLSVENSDRLDDHDFENIVVNCRYEVVFPAPPPLPPSQPQLPQRAPLVAQHSFALTPELYSKRAARPDVAESGVHVLRALFPGEAITESRVVSLNTHEDSLDGPWFSVEHKGGSFLVKPQMSSARVTIEDRPDHFPSWPRIDAAVSAGDTQYFFNNGSKVYATSDEPGAESAIGQRWGLKPSAIQRDGRVDAVLHLHRENRTYLFRGDEYVEYRNGDYSRTAPDSPSKLRRNRDGLPEWDRVDAAFQAPNSRRFFFDNTRQVFAASNPAGSLSAPLATAAEWGRVSNQFTRNGSRLTAAFEVGEVVLPEGTAPSTGTVKKAAASKKSVAAEQPAAEKKASASKKVAASKKAAADENPPADEQAATKKAAARRTRPGAVYLVSGQHFVRYGDQLSAFVDPGYPKDGGAKAILEDIGFSDVDETLAGVDVEAAYRADDVLHLYLPNKRVLDCDMSAWTISSRTDPGDPVGAAYRNNSGRQQLLRNDEYDAALTTGGKFYLFKGGDYMELADVPASFDSVSWAPRGRIATRFGREATRIATTGIVDAVADSVIDGVPYVYLISGDEYVRYGFDSNGNPKPFIDSGYPRPLEGNEDGLPNWPSIGAAFRGRNDRSYFFEADGSQYVVSTDLDRKLDIRDQWGLIPTDVSERGVAAAYVDGDKLFLISHADPPPPARPWWEWWHWFFGQRPPEPDPPPEYVRYTLRNGQPGAVIDEGYPRRLDAGVDRRVTAAFTLGQRSFLIFDGGYYAALGTGSEPSDLPGLRQLKGNWGNLPIQFASAMDSALVWSVIENETEEDETEEDESDGTAPGHNRLTLFSGRQTITYELGSGAAMPYEIDSAKFDVTRLSTSTGYILNQRLFTGGLDALLDRATQYTDEVPALDDRRSTPTRIRYDATRIDHAPVDSYLDFFSANGIYYWEVFFHAPMLIANALNTAQRFEDSKRWYEFVYDPTEPSDYWGFLPFVGIDIEAIDASARRSLDVLESVGVDLDGATELSAVLDTLRPMNAAFRGERTLDATEARALAPTELRPSLDPVRSGVTKVRHTFADGPAARALDNLAELAHVIEGLSYRYDLLQTGDVQLRAYLDDPFDPHAIAGARRIAYRKATVMAYVDNLLDWGDQLFGQYTMETINEARMLYVLAYDLLGRAPTGLGDRVLSPTRAYDGPGSADGLRDARDANTNVAFDPSASYDFLLQLEETRRVDPNRLPYEPTVHDTIVDSYFHIPDNELFRDYWSRVEDRLHKIRNCLNIMGVEQPLPLFQPPIDPMALVQAVGSGVPLGQVLAGVGTSIPHYRFTFMLAQARELTQKVSQFGNELLQTLEKRDAEGLSMMQSRQEAVILSMTRGVREAQLSEIEANIDSLRETHRNAIARAAHYDRLISGGMLPQEISQLGLMAAGAAAQYASIVLKALGGATYLVPEVTVGLFSFGAKMGGNNLGDALSSVADSVQTLGEALSMTGEALGVQAAFERMAQEWQLQKLVTASEIVQIEAQLRGAEFQRQAARREIEIMDREIEHNASITEFMQDKFTNQQLYQWMTGRLSATYFQTYQLAHEMARYAEQAFRYERGVPERDVAFIQPAYWDSQRKGLTAGDALGLDIDRMEQSFIETNARRLEISRNFSLLEIDPLALMTLRSTGTCEFRLDESLFDYDFPGHYCRQVKTISLGFDHADGSEVLATLTQLNHHTVLQPEPKAVKHLLAPSAEPPTSVRSDWRANQQVALSHLDEYDKNNGLFELRFDDDRYLPFEGTGAVSTWRLTMNGKRGRLDASKLNDVVVNLKYSAIEGGRAFGTAVQGLLKPYLTGVLIDVADRFPDAWDTFKNNGTSELALSVSREMFPDMASSKIAAIYTHFDRQVDGRTSMVVNGDDDLTLEHGGYLETTGLSVGNNGSEWSLVLDGDKAIVDNVQLVVIYKASVK